MFEILLVILGVLTSNLLSIRPSAESTEIFVERCAEAQSKQRFANLVVPDFFPVLSGFSMCISSFSPVFCWFSAGFLLVCSLPAPHRRQGMVQELIAFAANFSIRVVPEWRDVSFVFFPWKE
jgi:hypothetical protein